MPNHKLPIPQTCTHCHRTVTAIEADTETLQNGTTMWCEACGHLAIYMNERLCEISDDILNYEPNKATLEKIRLEREEWFHQKGWWG